MRTKYQYKSADDRERIIAENNSLILIEEHNITEGNFLIFSDEPLPEPVVYVTVPQEEFESLKQESTLLKAQSKALADRADFTDDVIAEIALEIYK
ncbi:hypothetical protein MKY59_20965 [Paenibacillus sp. FSL W8-0426]|uniref:hypothetical protein n=1 Tax=Paenibacillus sp. FSL W8-0426 TaxID=2921714 RepID=UPI0030D7F106